MARLPRVTARQAAARLRLLGCIFVRQEGSHRIYKNSRNQLVVIPFHGSKILHPKTLKSIMKEAGIEKW
ncbi:MAG TPA: type II toxin-antitoxin system HicA family toxin [Candidatus Paceibacterota bacterium]|nr:type II toxin-antitoxin system HicA family toxin [Candidatus Paceibacterota bacterium]